MYSKNGPGVTKEGPRCSSFIVKYIENLRSAK